MTASPTSPLAAPSLASHSFGRALLGFMLTTTTVTALLLLLNL